MKRPTLTSVNGADTDAPTLFRDVAETLAANGYRPVPIKPGLKDPRFDDWQKFEFKAGCEKGFPKYGAGVLLGDVVGLDVDVNDTECVAAIEAAARTILGIPDEVQIPRRIGRAPRVLLPLRATVPFAKRSTALFRMRSAPNPPMASKVEILAGGQQFVAYHVHPDTHAPYKWNGGGSLLDVPRDQLFEITEAQADAIIAEAETIMGRYGKCMTKKKIKDTNQHDEDREILHGERNVTLASIAGTFRRNGLSEAAIHAGLKQINARQCKPPLPDTEVEDIARSIARYAPADSATAWSLTDVGNAELLIAEHPTIRYVPEQGRWLRWDGVHWLWDDDEEVMRLAQQTVRGLYAKAQAVADVDVARRIGQHATRSLHRERLRAMIDLARSVEGVIVHQNQLDSNPMHLGVANGVVDLRTGELTEPDPMAYVTKVVGLEFNPDAECPRWEQFLLEVMADDLSMVRFIQRSVGYSLTGDTSEQCLFVCHGKGENGKSTMFEALMPVMGLYATACPMSALTVKRGDSIPNDVARLAGARFVQASEISEGRAFNEARIKDLTGGDTITARFLHREFFDFIPQFKLWLRVNHKPVVCGTGHAIWRRIRLVPFNQTFSGTRKDLKLPKKLQAELPGILAWAVRGCLEWQKHGLRPPEVVTAATAQYREEMDQVGLWVNDNMILGPGLSIRAKEAFANYCNWCRSRNEHPLTQQAFGDRIAERGIEKKRRKSGFVYFGIDTNGVTDRQYVSGG